jgi:hypothetical protein
MERPRQVTVLTGWSQGGREWKQGHHSSAGQEMRAAAVAGYFLRTRLGFPELLLVFEFSKEVSLL